MMKLESLLQLQQSDNFMDKYLHVLSKTKLFDSLPDEKLRYLLSKLNARIQTYEKNQTIISFDEPFTKVCILIEGTAHIMKEQAIGTSLLLSELEVGDMFAESYVFAQASNVLVSVVATSESKVCLLDFQPIFHSLSSDELAIWVLRRMLSIIASKNVALNERMELLSQRTMRDKIMLYLKRLVMETHNSKVTIPFSRSELAEYLSVDRSALSRELSQLQKDGWITYDGREFTILYKDDAD